MIELKASMAALHDPAGEFRPIVEIRQNDVRLGFAILHPLDQPVWATWTHAGLELPANARRCLRDAADLLIEALETEGVSG